MARKRCPGLRQGRNKALDPAQETIRLVNESISKGDVKALRKIAVVRGLVNRALRRKAWPLMLGLDCGACGEWGQRDYASLARPHRDSSVVLVDVARCLHATDEYVQDDNREDRRAALIQLLSAVVDGNTVFYYQGLHELAAVLMLEVGLDVAYPTLQHLVVTHLRDNTRAHLDATLDALRLLEPLLQKEDHAMAAHLHALQVPPYYAISWLLTWFAHDVRSMAELTRLFDLFLASHPLMPLYVGAVAMQQVRERILDAEDMPELHTLLVNLDILNVGLTINELAVSANNLIHKHPPAALAPSAPRSCSSVEAKLVDDAWWVPERATPGRQWPSISHALDSVLRLPAAVHGSVLLQRVIRTSGPFVALSGVVASAAVYMAFFQLERQA